MKKETLMANMPIILAISLPILLVLFIALLTFLPQLGPKPQFDFLFTQTSARAYYPANGGCEVYSNYYTIEGNALVKKPFEVSVFDGKNLTEPCAGYASVVKKDAPEIFIYKMKESEAKQISFEGAEKLASKGTLTSPDGYNVQKRFINGGGIFDIFGNRGSGGVFASKKNNYIKLNLPQIEESYYERDFNFISWVDSTK